MRWPLNLVMPIAVAASLAGCTITHSFGPYFGKVVDAETGEPLEGAVVLIDFNTKEYTLGGGTRSSFVDAVEVLTDTNGEFYIPAFRAWVLRFPHRWDPYAHVTIFKPGFGAYPYFKEIEKISFPVWSIPPKHFVIVKLPRLINRDDRLVNLGNVHAVGIPDRKLNILTRLIQIERNNLGLR